MSIIKSNGAGEAGGFKYNGVATRSVRFGVNNLLKNELDAPTNTQKLTLSMWFKRQRDGTEEALAGTNVDNNYIRFEAGGTIRMRDGSINLITTPIYRDTSAWYHIVVAWNLLDTTDNDKVIIYVNGVRQALGTNTLPSAENVISQFNVDGKENYIGAYSSGGVAGYYSGYIAEVNFIDGQNLGPSSFGETKNGIWIAKDTSGLTFGNNGFRLQFANNAVSTASSSTIGADTSGKDRHFTSAGIVASDCNMPDSPENNFCTLNHNRTGQIANLTNGSLTYKDSNTGGPRTSVGTMGAISGKWYFEIRLDSDLASTMSGFMDVSRYEGSHLATDTNRGTGHLGWDERGFFYEDSGSTNKGGGYAYTTNDVVSFAIDVDAGKSFVRKNADAFLGSGDPSDGSNPATTFTAGQPMTPFIASYRSAVYTLNCGQDSTFGGQETATTNADSNGQGAFHTAPPDGYLALCSANLPEPTVGPNSATLATDHFNTVIFTGDDNANRAVTGVGFKPDWLWHKARNVDGNYHFLFDSNRGVDKRLSSNVTDVEGDATGLDSFDVDGFTVDHEASAQDMNASAHTYVAWNWKANGGTATATINESGDNPAASVQANPTAGFSIITYTGTGDAGTIAHGLGVVPKWILIKNRDVNDAWAVYHAENTAAPATDYLVLNTQAATADAATYWADTAPTSSVFTIHDAHNVNADGEAYVAYVFAEVDGYSQFGSYIGNGDAEGPMVFTGFSPAFVMIKCSSNASTSWFMLDNVRDVNNEVLQDLTADTSNDETTNSNFLDFLSNGFKLRTTGSAVNGSGRTMIYMAFAEAPFKYANAQ